MTHPSATIGATGGMTARPLPPADGDAGAVARRLIADSRTNLGVDVKALRARIADLSARDPALGAAAQAAVARQLGPVDAGDFLSGIVDTVKGAIDKARQAVADAVKAAQVEGADGKRATTGPDLKVPARPADAPKTINFSRALDVRFDAQWDKSFPGGSAREQGGTLVFDRRTGQISLVNVGGKGSTAGTFTPDYALPDPKHQTLLGVYHTHPYDDGYTGISFSGADVAVAINGKHNLIMAQSGDTQFVMMRTAKTPDSVNYTRLNNQQNDRIAELMEGGKSFAAASSQASSELATRYHMAYYEGTNGHLSRINP